MKRLGTGTAVWVSAAALAVAMSFAAPALAAGPTGAVGWHTPAQKALDLDIHATAGSAPLDSASVLVDGTPAALTTVDDTAPSPLPNPLALCDAAAPHCYLAGPQGTGVKARLDTRQFRDGVHHFVVEARDESAQTTNIVDGTLEIDNTPRPNTSSATLTIGSGVLIPEPQPNSDDGQGGVRGASQSSCTSAKLSMLLTQRPVRIKHKVPVLSRNKKYRFTGRLTCLVNHTRHSAAKRTKVDVYAIVKGKRVHKATMRVASGGKLTVKLASPSSRTLEFRFQDADGKTTRVRIKITVVKAPKKHSKHHTQR
jgi:hypothetical protein